MNGLHQLKPTLFGKLLGNIQSVNFIDTGILVVKKNGSEVQIDFEDLTDIPELSFKLLGAVLVLQHTNKTHVLRYLNKQDCRAGAQYLQVEASRALSKRIKKLVDKFRKKSIDSYLRDSSIEDLDATPPLAG